MEWNFDFCCLVLLIWKRIRLVCTTSRQKLLLYFVNLLCMVLIFFHNYGNGMSRFTRVRPISSRSRHGVPVCHLSGPKKETDNKQCTDKWFSFEKVMMVFLSFPCFHNMFFANFVRCQTILQIFPWFHILCNWHISKFYNFTNAVQLVGFEDRNNGHIIVRSFLLDLSEA